MTVFLIPIKNHDFHHWVGLVPITLAIVGFNHTTIVGVIARSLRQMMCLSLLVLLLLLLLLRQVNCRIRFVTLSFLAIHSLSLVPPRQ